MDLIMNGGVFESALYQPRLPQRDGVLGLFKFKRCSVL
ncbi:MAG: hypothetical protein K0S33_37 [Bacteroidetes bacterium]|jgi:hypothetical protein|nr:hypothetical protein [Bacteroidota bacterium]